MRTFLAFETAPYFKSLIKKYSHIKNVSWNSNPHMTVEFLGEIDQNEIGYLSEKFEKIISSFLPIKVSKPQIEILQKKSQGIIWTRYKKFDTNLNLLVSKIRRAVSERGYLPQKRKPKPHITLGRIRGKIDENLIKNILSEEIEIKEMMFLEIIFFESVLDKGGARHYEIRRFPLS